MNDTEVGPKTKTAIGDLASLLEAVQKDGRITNTEFSQLHMWKVQNKTVSRRQVLRPHTDWLNEVLADGKVDAEEITQFAARAAVLKDLYAKCVLVTKEDAMRKQGSLSPDAPWRSHPASERQIDFLRGLGVPTHRYNGITKGQASDLIEETLAGGYPDPVTIGEPPTTDTPQDTWLFRVFPFLRWVFPR